MGAVCISRKDPNCDLKSIVVAGFNKVLLDCSGILVGLAFDWVFRRSIAAPTFREVDSLKIDALVGRRKYRFIFGGPRTATRAFKMAPGRPRDISEVLVSFNYS